MIDLSNTPINRQSLPYWLLSFGVLICVNLIPILGVIYLGWSVPDIVIIYWIESAVIGLLHVPRILARYAEYPMMGAGEAVDFMAIYGLFTSCLAVYLQVLFDAHMALQGLFEFGPLFWVTLCLVVAHGVTLLRHLSGGRVTKEICESVRTYPRLAIMCVVIVFGGIAYKLFADPLIVIVLMVLAKLIFDIGAFIREIPRRPSWAEAVKARRSF